VIPGRRTLFRGAELAFTGAGGLRSTPTVERLYRGSNHLTPTAKLGRQPSSPRS